jgi:hypothetical protein
LPSRFDTAAFGQLTDPTRIVAVIEIGVIQLGDDLLVLGR